MKVLMTTDAVGGVWTYATELAGALDAEVTLAVVGPHAPAGAGLHHAGRLEWQEEPWEDVEAQMRWLAELVEEHRPDVLHLNQYAFGRLDVPCAKVVVAHSCVCSWHAAVRGTAAGVKWARYHEVVSAGLRGADRVVAPTHAMAREVARHYGVGAQVIHNGVGSASGAPPGARSEPPRARDRRVLAAGRLWDEAKGLDVLDAAAATSRWPVDVAGPGGDARHVRKLGVLDRDALRARMARATVFAHPARYEPFGLAPLEAAQAGCALVLGNIASLRELWDGAALFVPPGDAVALATALDLLARDDALRERLARRAREAAAGLSAVAMAAHYDALYAEVAAGVRA